MSTTDSHNHRQAPALFTSQLADKDKQLLREVAHRLLSHGSLLRARSSERALYDWCLDHQPWVDDWADLLGLKLVWQREERVLIALPESPALTRKLRKDETLVALALWYDYDVEVRENGAHEVKFSVAEFNSNLDSKFPKMQGLSASRLKDILRLLARLNLIEMDWHDQLAESRIEVLPTLRFAIPFPDLEEWLRYKQRFDETLEADLQQEEVVEAPQIEAVLENEANPSALAALGAEENPESYRSSIDLALNPEPDAQKQLFEEDSKETPDFD